jgi:putative phage-type endonuclease
MQKKRSAPASSATKKKRKTKAAPPKFVAPTHDRLGDPIDERVRKLIELNHTLPDQRTSGWYEQRKNCMTASPISAVLRLTELEIKMRDDKEVDMKPAKKVGHVMPAFNSYAELMRIKCGVGPAFTGSVHTEWGVAYEPVVTALYECIEDTVVHEFGLIPHPTLDWLGASPDGITSQGRMLEIKCPFSRIPKELKEGISIPKMQYWVQMQIQMECCGFDECDYADIMIREYGSRDEYLRDFYEDPEVGTIYSRTAVGRPKGFILERNYFDEESVLRHEYFYPPVLSFTCQQEEDAWIADWAKEHLLGFTTDEMVDIALHKTVNYDIRYWYVENWLVRTVKKNKKWLEDRLPEVHDFWKLVLKYREEGIPDDLMRPPARESSTPSLSSSSSSLRTSSQGQQTPLYIDPVNNRLTTKQSSTASQECLFWDSDEDIDQPIVTNGP